METTRAPDPDASPKWAISPGFGGVSARLHPKPRPYFATPTLLAWERRGGGVDGHHSGRAANWAPEQKDCSEKGDRGGDDNRRIRDRGLADRVAWRRLRAGRRGLRRGARGMEPRRAPVSGARGHGRGCGRRAGSRALRAPEGPRRGGD